eukprot:TRINITY_DN1235_c0_g1_i2.p1 TRINITY_DN1235_c0_g1~~TRINITY_DN1235_c0_g1_i2.p1  ORF type:complete len:415 (+),score=102.66 TRINITY_DN1235_c0_g1_i2:137-1381(+)
MSLSLGCSLLLWGEEKRKKKKKKKKKEEEEKKKMLHSITVASPINIAFIKYWGKVDEDLIIPCNDSFSITLGTDQFRTKTSIAYGDWEGGDKLWLNGEEQTWHAAGRLGNVLRAVRDALPENEKTKPLRVVSENNFPTAAGMASSAAGLSALAYGLVHLFKAPIDISQIARLGSGSACRSVLGGFVKWVQGDLTKPDTSVSIQHKPNTHWENLNVLCLVSKPEKKDIPSTQGMRYASTSPFMKERVDNRVPERMELASESIDRRDFESFAAVTMADCEDFRNVCRTSDPKVDYWNEITEEIVSLVKAFNDYHGRLRAAYTYDAGANAFIFIEDNEVPLFLSFVLRYFPTDQSAFKFSDPSLARDLPSLPASLDDVLPGERKAGVLTYILHSKVGSGPSILDEEESLLTKDGLPK